MAHLLEDFFVLIALAPLEYLQDPQPYQRDRRNECAEPPRQTPGLCHYDYQK